MRPPEFTGGNESRQEKLRLEEVFASMRPPEFTGGNSTPTAQGASFRSRLQ